MHYIVGLGNPGAQYVGTRHNVGFAALDALVAARHLPTPVRSAQYAGAIVEGTLAGAPVVLLYPETFMNHSGSAVRKLVPREDVARLIVIYDDIDLPLGTLKVSVGRGDGGHNGVKSIMKELGSKDFVRVRIGIAPRAFWSGKPYRPAGEKLGRHVLGRFGRSEAAALADGLAAAVDAIETVVRDGAAAAMNRYN